MDFDVQLKDSIAVLRDFSDYTVTVDDAGLPQGVELLRKIG